MTTYKQCRTYALVVHVDAGEEDAKSVVEFLERLQELTEGWTVFTARIDDQYADACGPDIEVGS